MWLIALGERVDMDVFRKFVGIKRIRLKELGFELSDDVVRWLEDIVVTALRLCMAMAELLKSCTDENYRRVIKLISRLEEYLEKSGFDPRILIEEFILLGEAYLELYKIKPDESKLLRAQQHFGRALEATRKTEKYRDRSRSAHGVAKALRELAKATKIKGRAKKLLEKSIEFEREALEAAQKIQLPTKISEALRGLEESLNQLLILSESQREQQMILEELEKIRKMGKALKK